MHPNPLPRMHRLTLPLSPAVALVGLIASFTASPTTAIPLLILSKIPLSLFFELARELAFFALPLPADLPRFAVPAFFAGEAFFFGVVVFFFTPAALGLAVAVVLVVAVRFFAVLALTLGFAAEAALVAAAAALVVSVLATREGWRRGAAVAAIVIVSGGLRMLH